MSRSIGGHRAAGHGVQRTGSLTVADLLRREHRPVPILASVSLSANKTTATELLSPPVTEVHGVRGRIARTTKVVGLALGALTLCGSIAVASTLTHTVQPDQLVLSPAVRLDG